MSRKLNGWGLAVLLIAALVVITGCADTAQQEADAAAAARQQAWADLQEQKAELDEARQELAEARAAAEAEDGEGEEAAAEPEVNIAQLEADVDQKTEDFYSALVEFINAEPLLEGEEPSELQMAAIRMKSEEDMLVAEEYVEKGGNYRRAIDIYSAALAVDPDNPDLQAALAEAEANRYMTEERFGQVEEGMTSEEVRGLLGTPFHANVREFPDDGVTAWFYPVDPQGSSAAVWFRPRNGELTVYKTSIEMKEGPEEVGGEDAAEG